MAKKSFSFMSVLLFMQGYPPAVVVAFALHAVVLYFVLDKELSPNDLVDLEQPVYVSAMTIQENPQRLRRLENERQVAAAADTRRREQEAERQRATEAAQRREQQERERVEQERLAQERTDRESRERREREERRLREEQQRIEQERAEALARQEEIDRQNRAAEAQRQAQAQAEAQNAADNQSIQAYTGIIHQAITNNWSIPPSARNGMIVVLNLRLVPTGEVITVNIVESSGDPAFDRSALQAVARAERFPELQQMPSRLFERQFRSVTLRFRPEDLLR